MQNPNTVFKIQMVRNGFVFQNTFVDLEIQIQVLKHKCVSYIMQCHVVHLHFKTWIWNSKTQMWILITNPHVDFKIANFSLFGENPGF